MDVQLSHPRSPLSPPPHTLPQTSGNAPARMTTNGRKTETPQPLRPRASGKTQRASTLAFVPALPAAPVSSLAS